MAAHLPHLLRRRPPKLGPAELIQGLVFHFLGERTGTLGQHMSQLTGKQLSEEALSERRQQLPALVFEDILAEALRPLAERTRQPEAFYRGKRLLCLDGTQFSLANTPQVLARLPKPTSRRLQAAFAKLGCCVLTEVGTHAPVAAAIASAEDPAGQSEQALAAQVLGLLPKGEPSLLLADRLYGSGAFLARLLACAPQGQKQAFVVRVGRAPKPKLVRRLADGSRLVRLHLDKAEAALLAAATTTTTRAGDQAGKQSVQVREVRARVRRLRRRLGEYPALDQPA